MIKRILSTFLVSSAIFVVAITNSMADRPTFAVGYSAAFGGYFASGQENEGGAWTIAGAAGKGQTPQEINKDTAAGEIGYSSLFLEVSFADRVTLGASWMADAVETDMSERTDNLCSGAQPAHVGDVGCSSRGQGNNTGTSTAKAEFSNLITTYVELNIWNGLYAKYGIMEMDVDTKESLHTDSSYPNATMDGTTYGLGWKGSFDNGVFIKTETLMQDWSRLKITSDGNKTGHSNDTSVELNLAGAVAQISIGKAF